MIDIDIKQEVITDIALKIADGCDNINDVILTSN